MGRYKLSPRAKLDLDEISDKIASDNPLRAITFVDELIVKFEMIGDHPHGYATRPDRRIAGSPCTGITGSSTRLGPKFR